MKYLSIIFSFALLMFVSACGGQQSELSEEEMTTAETAETMADEGYNPELVAELHQSRDFLLSSLEDVGPEQWTFRESEERWSIAEVVEHLVLAENLFRGLVADSVLTGEMHEYVADSAAKMDEAITMMITDRSQPIPTIPPLEPTGAYETVEEGVAAFKAAQDKTIELVKSTDADLRAYSRALGPDMPPMDAAQWILFDAGHVQRHTEQILQVKDHEDYPAGSSEDEAM